MGAQGIGVGGLGFTGFGVYRLWGFRVWGFRVYRLWGLGLRVCHITPMMENQVENTVGTRGLGFRV